mmetsp:Transcript_4875/g.10114  ORF Transcript_4875/g.10114 Transcript_4875/m.10114 type:complete len:218 (-) Transcript_4875:57-710(-)
MGMPMCQRCLNPIVLWETGCSASGRITSFSKLESRQRSPWSELSCSNASASSGKFVKVFQRSEERNQRMPCSLLLLLRDLISVHPRRVWRCNVHLLPVSLELLIYNNPHRSCHINLRRTCSIRRQVCHNRTHLKMVRECFSRVRITTGQFRKRTTISKLTQMRRKKRKLRKPWRKLNEKRRKLRSKHDEKQKSWKFYASVPLKLEATKRRKLDTRIN